MATANRMRTTIPHRLWVWSRFALRNRTASVALLFLSAAVCFSIIGPLVGTGDPQEIHPTATFAAPSSEFPMGTDRLGRSMFARLVVAFRYSLGLAVLCAAIAAICGTLLGMIVGYLGGLTDQIVMRFMDMGFAFPMLLMAILVAAVIGTGAPSVVVTIIVVTLPAFSRVARGPTLSVRQREYVTAAIVNGASLLRILSRHVLPNILPPVLVQLSFTLSVALIVEGALSFLGLGIQPPKPSLGSLLRDGKNYLEIAPWTVLVPGMALALAILAINIFGDWLRDFLDPKLRHQER